MKNFLTLALALGLSALLSAKDNNKVALSTNLVEIGSTQTLNIDASLSLSRHFSLAMDARYNPYPEKSRQRSVAVGARYWPWYVYSGLWMGGKARYQEFSFRDSLLREGDRVGLSLSGGYSYMIGEHFNIDVGLGLWTGYEMFKVYGCETCSRIREKGNNYFLLPDEFLIAITYIF